MASVSSRSPGHRTRTMLLTALAGAVVTGLIVAVALRVAHRGDAAQEAWVTAAATRAIVVTQQLGTPNLPAASWGVVQPAPADCSSQTSAGTPASASELASARSAGQAQVTAVFGQAPGAKARALTALDHAIAAQEPAGTVRYGSGASNVTYQQVTIDGDSAQTVARVAVWTLSSELAAAGEQVVTCPRSELIVTTTLSRLDGSWAVVELTWTFAPGSEP